MTQAIFGLVGVIIGAAAAIGLGVWRERREDAVTLRGALRIVALEFHSGRGRVDGALRSGEWSKGMAELSLDEWFLERRVLAAHLEATDWLRVQSGALVVEGVRAAAESRFLSARVEALERGDDSPTPVSVPVTEADRAWLEGMRGQLGEVLEVLESLHSPVPGTIGLWRWSRRQRAIATVGRKSR